MKLYFFYFLFCLSGMTVRAQDRGSLLLAEHPQEVTRFLAADGTIHLTAVRATAHLLTDDTWTQEGELVFPNRKKAVIRHIRQLNEVLERYWYEKKPADSVAMEYLYELALYEASYLQKTKQDSRVDLSDKVQMGWNSLRTRSVLRYRIPFKMSHNHLMDPVASPYWRPLPDSLPLHKAFDRLAKEKKIKAKKQMVVLFDQLSIDGSAPKIDAIDPDMDNGWCLKWGDEVHTDVVGSRIFAALGYDTDHPYFYEKGCLTLIFQDTGTVKNAGDLTDRIRIIYGLNLNPFIALSGIVTEEIIVQYPELAPYTGKHFVQFTECAVEARPDRVKRLGSFLPEGLNNHDRKALRASLLAHQLIGNWDTREANTLLTQVHSGNYRYRVSAVFSDLGTSLGVTRHTLPPDFKTGLVNELGWEAVKRKKNRIVLLQPMNELLSCYTEATYEDLRWMAVKIAALDSADLRKIIAKAGWPESVAELYFHKLASRRQSILSAFDIKDPHPIDYNRQLTMVVNGVVVVKNGELVMDWESEDHPESLTCKKGRFRNYGRKK